MADRRHFLARLTGTLLAVLAAGPGRVPVARAGARRADETRVPGHRPPASIRLFLCGDVMTGRGIDQILPQSCAPRIYEPFLHDARDYVRLAEQVNGPVGLPVDYAYVWGDALAEWQQMAPDLRIVNLETAVTEHERPWPKGINYRMHPDNAAVLLTAAIDCCVLANNHVLDWGAQGLAQTLDTLAAAGIRVAGAGAGIAAARAPAVLPVAGRGRVLVFAYGAESSGIPAAWAASADTPGVALLPDLSGATVAAIAAQVAAVKRPGDIAVASIHWGGNWGYEILPAQRAFARALVEHAGVDLVHGHSSHHPKGIEVYRDRPILYGCGDFLNDYEGIRGHAEYRAELGLMYFPEIDPASGRLQRLVMTPTRIRRLRVERASPSDARWLAQMLNREGHGLGTRVDRAADGRLLLHWAPGQAAAPAPG